MLASVAALALYAVGVSSMGSSAAFASGHGSRPDARTATVKSSVKSVTHRYHSTTGWPRSTGHHGGGAINLSENGTLQRFVNRSNSPRPKANRLLASKIGGWLPQVTSTPVTSKPTNAGMGWQGLNEYDNQKFAGFNVEPPDQGLCAGGGHVFEMINDVVQVYSTSGAPQTKPVYINKFFGEKGYQFLTDPSCVYDAGSQRYFATELTLVVNPKTGGLTLGNRLDLAVSKTSDPRGGWNFYRIPTTDAGGSSGPQHRSCPCIGDYPHLATDANGVYLTTNEYPWSGKGIFGNFFNGAQLYALSKTAVVSGAASTSVVHFENLRVPSITGNILVGFTVWPSMSAGTEYATANNGTEYFTSSFAADEARPGSFSGHGNQIGLWWLSNTGSLKSGTPNLSLHVKVMNSEAYGIPPLSKQKAGPTPLLDCLRVTKCYGFGNPYQSNEIGSLDSSDSRVLTSVYSNGHVISALDTAMVVAGNVQAGLAWVDIAASGTGSSMASQGYVGTRGNNITYPGMATNPAGAGVVGVTLVGNNWYPSQAYLRWNSSALGGINVAAAGKAPQDGFCEYAAFGCGGRNVPRPRWGDYGSAAWDGHNFYVANEYIAHRCTFDQFIADNTCGKTRTLFGNFSTHIQRLSP